MGLRLADGAELGAVEGDSVGDSVVAERASSAPMCYGRDGVCGSPLHLVA